MILVNDLFDDVHELLLNDAAALSESSEIRHFPDPEIYNLIVWNIILAPIAGVIFSELFNKMKNKRKAKILNNDEIDSLKKEVEKLSIEKIIESKEEITLVVEEKMHEFGLTRHVAQKYSKEIFVSFTKHSKK